MALKAILETINGLDEAMKAHYRAGTADEGLNGKFVLAVDGADGWFLENIQGLKSAIGKERRRADDAESAVKAFEGIDAKKAQDAIKKIAELGDIDPAKEADKLAASKVEAFRAQMIENHAKEIAAVAKQAEVYKSQLQKVLVSEAATKAIAAAKGRVNVLLPHVERAIRLKETDGGFVAKIVGADENLRVGNGGQDMTIEEFVAEFRGNQDFAGCFESSGASGGGTPANGSAAGSGRTITRAQFEALPPGERMSRITDGSTVVD